MTPEYPRFQLNRGLIVLRYKQPYIDWVRTAGELPMDLTLENANDDSEAFLVSSFDSPIDPVDGTENAIKWVEKRWRMFFEISLAHGFLMKLNGRKSAHSKCSVNGLMLSTNQWFGIWEMSH